MNIETALSHHRIIAEQIRQQFPDETEADLADTIEGQSSLPEALFALMRSAVQDEAHCDALEKLIDEMKARHARLAHRAERKRAIVLGAMERAEIRKPLEGPDMTLSLAKVPAKVIVMDEQAISADFMRTPEPPPPSPDKTKIKEALLAKQDVPGCTLSNGGVRLACRRV